MTRRSIFSRFFSLFLSHSISPAFASNVGFWFVVFNSALERRRATYSTVQCSTVQRPDAIGLWARVSRSLYLSLSNYISNHSFSIATNIPTHTHAQWTLFLAHSLSLFFLKGGRGSLDPNLKIEHTSSAPMHRRLQISLSHISMQTHHAFSF